MSEIVPIKSRPVPTDKAKLVRYVGDMCREMGKMANGESLDFLAYLLYLVVAEADRQSNSELTADPEGPLQS